MSKPADKYFADSSGSQTADAADETAGAGIADEVPRTDFPCSVAQERFWLLDRLDPGNASYNVAVRWRLEGRVSTEILERAWLEIIERHEVLRSVFFERDGAPVQRVMPRTPFKLDEIDLSTLPPDQQQIEGDRIGGIEARAPFDLNSGPLIRATLLRFSPTSSIILVTTHQIVSDGWSIGVMAREMGVIYEALRHDKPVPLPPLAIQYADYSLWQLEWLRVRGTATETAYWTQQLHGVKPFKVLPDRVLPPIPTTNGSIVSRVLPRDLTNRAQALCAERGATLFAAALAALCATLSRYTRDEEIVLGTQVSDRDQVELESMVGQFVNSLILRNDLRGNPDFGVLIDRVRETSVQALEHRHIPIERLLGMVKAERNQANSPPISVNFIFQKTFIQNTKYADFDLIDMPSLPAGAIYDLNFFMVERPDGWRFSCQYNTDQFERSTAVGLLAYIETLLDSAVRNPSQRLSQLTLSVPDEAREMVSKLNDTRALYPRDLSVSQVVDAQASRIPDGIAVSCGDKNLTYAQLIAASNKLAAYLLANGIAPGTPVGVCLPRSIELPTCVLAMLRAGVAAVLVDPTDPPLRRAATLRKAGATAVIEHRLTPAGVADGSVRAIDIDAAMGAPAVATPPLKTVSADSIACRMSATELTHRNLINLISSLAKQPGIGERDVLVAVSPVTTHRAIVELLAPLLTGARLVVATEKDSASGRALLHLLQRSGATIMYATAQTWLALLEANWIGFPALKMLCSTADMNTPLIERLASMSGELWSLFGVAETGVWSAARHVQPRELPGAIGAPVANTSMFMLEPNHELTALGGIGELHIAGDGLTPTALAKCVVTRFGATAYPTGFLARLQANGRIDLVGRLDDQFTCRGHAVDPTEIEHLLSGHPAVLEAAVARARDGVDSSVAAFVAPRRDAPLSGEALTQELERLLADNLPEPLRPTTISLRDALPRLPNGAVDRRSLQVTKARPHKGTETQRPASDTEERLAALWKSMLGVDSVAAADNFFELGGHSLLAARMLAQVEREFGRRIKLAALFLAPTLQEFAHVLTQNDLREFDFRQVVKIQPHGSKRPLIAINNTGIYYSLAKSLGPEQPVFSLQLFDPSVRESTLPDSLEAIAAGYVTLIRRVQPHGPYDLMGWCVAGSLAYEVARQLAEQKEEVSRLFMIDTWLPNYYDRLPQPLRFIAKYSLRMQLVKADWRRVLTGEKSFGAFLEQRTFYKRLRGLRGDSARKADTVPMEEAATPETYDQWLLAYLQGLTNRYTPKPYAGKVTLLRSRLEPSGWFFRDDAGWGPYVASPVDVQFIDGDHFTMFQEPGASQMAARVTERLNTAP